MDVIAVPRRYLDAQVMLMSLRLIHGLTRWTGKPEWLLRFEVELTRSVGLFDRDHYLGQLDPGSVGQRSALRHYVEIGDALGLSPSPLFDVHHYDQHGGPRHGLNRLLHYGLISRFQGRLPTPWFDAEYYLRTNPDVAQSGTDPLEHFQKWGWRDGRSPLPGLDIRRLIQQRPELRVLRGPALGLLAADWLQHQAGLAQQAQETRPQLDATGRSLKQDVQDPATWSRLEPRRWDKPPAVTVLVPVYAGHKETLRCLWSVLTAPVRTPFRRLVINDAGPVPELNAMLRSLAARGLFTLEQNKANQGFVRTVNRGLALSGQDEVVILNSDTEVYNDWLDRLLWHAEQFPRLGTITPLSNNATICSYPEWLGDNRLPLELDHAELDRLAAVANARSHVEAPTGVGFCMYIRRQALLETGTLDERRFGRGYGEENDLCQRMLRKGWRNGLACDVYVRHVGSVSFKAEAQQRTEKALKTLSRLHPQYLGDVQRFIVEDPVKLHRARLDLARLQRKCTERNVLLVCHNRGGGTERHLVEQAESLDQEGCGVFEMRPSSQTGCVAITHAGLFGLPNLAAIPLFPGQLLKEVLQTLAISELHIHHLIDFPPSAGPQLAEVCADLGIALRLAIHDYYTVCPRVNLVDASGRYCGEPTASGCNQCLAADRLGETVGSIESWREASAQLLAAAQRVVVPSGDVARRLRTLLPALAVEVEPHDQITPAHVLQMPPPQEGMPLRLLVIGAINRIKGFEVVAGLAREIRQQAAPISLGLLGFSSDDAVLAGLGVTLHGRYFDHELPQRITELDPHLILVPSIWPETYCYVLSGALSCNRRVMVFDLGAQAERVRKHHPQHVVVPLALSEHPEHLLQRLTWELKQVAPPAGVRRPQPQDTP
ncbi:glycosyltransferase [Ideonella livida]|uniref:Glycosyltransferase n=1 Tax=Ideonella livida TaxID=2707176 RepID=A0A7C9TI63_9BURK|nr:glycosyltransferase [Ideonella livida]NDY90898.1 glycosyltransferase [Ideonella livida]